MQSELLAYLMPSFLESDDARPLRILAEYLEPLKRFRDENIQDTVVFFGSARIRSREAAERCAGGAQRRRRRSRQPTNGRHAEKGRAVVPLLRRRARARETADDVEPIARVRRTTASW